MHVRGFFFLKYFYIAVLVLLVGDVCLFNTFRQGQKLHAFFLPRKCVEFPPPHFFSFLGGGDGSGYVCLNEVAFTAPKT